MSFDKKSAVRCILKVCSKSFAYLCGILAVLALASGFCVLLGFWTQIIVYPYIWVAPVMVVGATVTSTCVLATHEKPSKLSIALSIFCGLFWPVTLLMAITFASAFYGGEVLCKILSWCEYGKIDESAITVKVSKNEGKKRVRK